MVSAPLFVEYHTHKERIDDACSGVRPLRPHAYVSGCVYQNAPGHVTHILLRFDRVRLRVYPPYIIVGAPWQTYIFAAIDEIRYTWQ